MGWSCMRNQSGRCHHLQGDFLAGGLRVRAYASKLILPVARPTRPGLAKENQGRGRPCYEENAVIRILMRKPELRVPSGTEDFPDQDPLAGGVRATQDNRPGHETSVLDNRRR